MSKCKYRDPLSNRRGTEGRREQTAATQSARRAKRLALRRGRGRGLLKTAPGHVARPARGCRVKFAPETKTNDGLRPVHKVLDDVVWSFFARKIRAVEDVYDHVAQDQLHHLVKVYLLFGDLLERAKRAPGGKAVNLLPRGGGRGSMVKYPAHNDALTYLRELLRRAHNRLHDAAGVVARMSKVNATAFVMHCARHPEELARFSKLGPAALPLHLQQQEQEQQEQEQEQEQQEQEQQEQ